MDFFVKIFMNFVVLMYVNAGFLTIFYPVSIPFWGIYFLAKKKGFYVNPRAERKIIRGIIAWIVVSALVWALIMAHHEVNTGDKSGLIAFYPLMYFLIGLPVVMWLAGSISKSRKIRSENL